MLSSPRLAVATCSALPGLDVDDRPYLDALRARGCAAEPVAWDADGVDWDVYDLVVVRNTWDYAGRRPAFLAWARGLGRVANPAPVLEMNTDKRYLAGLAGAGVPTVPTRYVEPADALELPAWPEFVVKPTVSAGAADTARWRAGVDDEAAAAHLAGLLASGRTAMVQPYLGGVDAAGETAMIYIGGRFSHAARKGPLLVAGAAPEPLAIDDHDPREVIVAREPSAAERDVAEAALDAFPADRQELLYARVDLIPGEDGRPVVIELELTEPSLFQWTAPGAAERLADATLALLAD